MGWLGGLFNLLGSGIGGLVGIKRAQADSVRGALEVLSDVNATDEARAVAAARIITAEARSESWLTANWRPLFMVFFGVLIGARWFGYVPPNMSEAELMEIYGLFKIGIGGYIGSRGIEKMLSGLRLGPVLQKFVEKRLV
jgi:hypothetical protein